MTGHRSLTGSKLATRTGNTNPPASGRRFTPESIHSLLREVLIGNEKLPSPRSRALMTLAGSLNDLQAIARSWKGSWRTDLASIYYSIYILKENLPKWRDEYAKELATFDHFINKLAPGEYAALSSGSANNIDQPADQDFREEGRLNLAALNGLVEAASVAYKRGLPLAPMITLAMPIEGWTWFAQHLQMVFHHTLPEVSKAAGYRFIAAVTPDITGEAPTYSAVETQLKKNRPVNRSKRPR
jgi:hypothetical protein